MATFVLVHGAWLGGWCYKRVARVLRRSGHEVYTPTLTGLGERAHLMNPSISLDTHIDDVLGVIRWEELSDIVLCGHSYGGAVISGVTEKAVDKIRSLVFLDAFVPENGQSHMDLFPSERAEITRGDAQRNGEGYKLTPPPAERVNVNAADVAWVNAMCVKHPLACFEQKLTLTGVRERVPRRTYILATGYQLSPFEKFAARFDHDLAWQVKRIDCGHIVMLDHPEELGDILVAAA
jgi:pimeloyl-ACP methyl ester carboxylesterase